MTALLLRKSGEGSRGGKIIAHTKTGKPVYQSGHARYASMHVHDAGDIGKDAGRVDSSFLHYSPGDHAEAASAHFKEAYKADHGRKSASAEGGQHLRAALAHNRLANIACKSMSSPNLSKAGAGTRGGVILGSTRSGKPIYASGHHTSQYHGVDHTDAAEAHNAHGFLAHIHRDTATSQHHQRLAQRHLDAARGPQKKPKPNGSVRRPLHEVLSHVFAQHSYAKSASGFDAVFESYIVQGLRMQHAADA